MQDALQLAAACEQAIQETVDPQRRRILTHLRNLWIAFANENHSLDADAFTQEYTKIATLHAEVCDRRATAVRSEQS
jgi:hypothetical protein